MRINLFPKQPKVSGPQGTLHFPGRLFLFFFLTFLILSRNGKVIFLISDTGKRILL